MFWEQKQPPHLQSPIAQRSNQKHKNKKNSLYIPKTEILTFTLQFVHKQFLYIDFESPHKLLMLPKEVG